MHEDSGITRSRCHPPFRAASIMSRREFEGLFSGTSRFTGLTRTCLERAVGRALLGRRGGVVAMRTAVSKATRELSAHGHDSTATLSILGTMVENAGRSCGADRRSLVSGTPFWVSVRARVLESAELELARFGASASGCAEGSVPT